MQIFVKGLVLIPVLCTLFIPFFGNNPHVITNNRIQEDSLSEADRRSVKHALKGLSVAKGVEISLFSSEPIITNPTNIDIDYRGRVWVSEAFNYRPIATGNLPREAGDRIMILEDTNHDGKADTAKVFYQGKEIHAPIGICVLGNSVIVSQAPNVWLLTDHDGDDKADKIEAVFTGISGEQHDHAIHSFSIGPDGKLYFAMGNESKQLLDRHGKPVRGKDGMEIDFKKYREGLLLRCDRDFTNIEILGHNFRNNFEPAVDSYGTIWQSDNDDDGNRAVRINYVMENGNYGFTDELTGAGWRAVRTNWEDSIPSRHWHQNDPGVVPNLIHTGAGSPTGLTVYEGDMLPEIFRNQLLHCDAGPNVVRAYPVEKQGAGYTAKMENLVEGKWDKWFRPTDVAVAPDGSVFVSDWYDPIVGGHHMGDAERGRVYRISSKQNVYTFVPADLTTTKGIINALKSPNAATRYEAWKVAEEKGVGIVPELKKFLQDESNAPRHRARIIWLLSKMKNAGFDSWVFMLKSSSPDLRITTIRALNQLGRDIIPFVKDLVDDKDPQVRREIALALHHNKSSENGKIWAKLAVAHKGDDRWYLEALGIGAAKQWDSYFNTWLETVDNKPIQSEGGRDIVWRSRSKSSLPYLTKLIVDNTTKFDDKLRYLRALDFNPGDKTLKSEALLTLLKQEGTEKKEVQEIIFRHLDPQFVASDITASRILKKTLDETYGTQKYLDLVGKYGINTEMHRLLEMAIEQSRTALGRSAGQLLWNNGAKELLKKEIFGKDLKRSSAVLASLRSIGSDEIVQILETILKDTKYNQTLKIAAVQCMAGTWPGEELLLTYLRGNKLSEEVKLAAIKSMSNAWRKGVRIEANSYLKENTTKKEIKHPPINELITKSGNVQNGKKIFKMYCEVCHQVGNEGFDFGPKLTEIGSKLPKEGLYMALFYPNAGVSFGYETSEIKLKDGSVVIGIITSKTNESVSVKFPGGTVQQYAQSDIQTIGRIEESMMPGGLEEAMTTPELIDLIEYMQQLK